MGVDDARYAKIQERELGWWQNYNFNPQGQWTHYDKVLAPYLGDMLDFVADVGCGPVPYFLNPLVRFMRGLAVDPLIHEYAKIEKYRQHWVSESLITAHTSTLELFSGELDVVFCLNTLDHAQYPGGLVRELHRVVKEGGLLFLLVDVNKEPDPMHPHKIELDWARTVLLGFFDEDLFKVEKSWKFSSDVLYFVGRKINV